MRARTREKIVFIILLLAAIAAAAACSSSSSDDDDGTAVDGGTADTNAPVDSSPADAARAEPSTHLATRDETICALKAGVVSCWGSNAEGQLAIAPIDSTPHPTPAVVTGIGFTPTVIANADYHTCVTNGTQLTCWGDDSYDQGGQVPTADAGCQGFNDYICPTPILVTGFGAVAELELGQYNTCVRGSSGTVQCSGADYTGLLGVSADGGAYLDPIAISGLSNIVQLAVGEESACALASNGDVSCWGYNEYGQLGQKTGPGVGIDDLPHPNPLQVPGVTAKQVSIGSFHVCAVLTDGSVTCWGYDADTGASAAGGELGHDPALDSLCSGNTLCDPTPSAVAGLSDVREVATGYEFSCAVKNDDTVMCWGDNSYGQLNGAPSVGDGGHPPFNFTPQAMPGLTNVAHIALGGSFACAVTWDDHVHCWGDNTYGQLGIPVVDGGPNFSPTPVTPPGF